MLSPALYFAFCTEALLELKVSQRVNLITVTNRKHAPGDMGIEDCRSVSQIQQPAFVWLRGSYQDI
jgi:hypothetical protein